MAQSYTTDSGVTLFDPGTYVETQVLANQSNTPTAGVVTLVGEANEGPDYTQEADLDLNSFGPDQFNNILVKYGSGNLVDAARNLIGANADPAITGAVSSIKLVKTNPSTKAQATMARPGIGGGAYAILQARRAGAPGNLINYVSSTSQVESAPTTGAFTYAPLLTGTATLKLRNNGGTQKTVTISSLTSGPSLAAQIEDHALGLLAHGGLQTLPLSGLTGIAITAVASGQTLVVTLAPGSLFASAPAMGDTICIPLSGQYGASVGSAIIGAANANVGCYVVTGAVNTLANASVTLLALNITGGAPVSTSGTIGAGTTDMVDFSPMTIENVTGQTRTVASGSQTWTTTSNDGTNVVLQNGTAWAAQPQVGDTVMVPSTFAGITAGFYTVTASTITTVSLSRLSNDTAGTTGIVTSVIGMTVMKPDIDGVGKTMEMVGNIAPWAKTAAGAAASFSNSLLISSAEMETATSIANSPTTSSTFAAGGDIVLQLGCINGSATVTVGASSLTLTSSSGVITCTAAQYTTMSALVSFLNSQTGYTASLGSAGYANASLSILDMGTFNMNCDATQPDQTCRLKHDADSWNMAVKQSGLATPVARPAAGLPGTTVPAQFLSGGTKAGTGSMTMANALDACSGVTTNFVVTCVSQDAILDIALGLTDPSSTYTIDATNSLLKTHVMENSTLIARQNRIGLASKEDTYANQKEAAAEMSYFRVMFCGQDQKVVGADGLIHQYQPWMGCVLAAGQQAAAGFRGIVKKFVNTNGAVQASGDFNPKSYSDRVDALKSGMLFMESVPTGGWRWVSDQTTYTQDNNFVFNSMQAVYISDLMALSLIQTFNNAVVGKSIAQITAAAGLGVLSAAMFDFLRLSWIAPSSDAPKGYKNASVKITGGVMAVSVEVKLAGLIYFVPISFNISEVTQTA